MTNLEKIDYACVMTKRRYESYYNNDQKMNEHLVQALTNALKLNYSGFTRENNARSEIMTLSKEELEGLTILKNGYIDLVFENTFYKDGKFMFFDQEWYKDGIPIEYLLYRAINNMYSYNLELNQILNETEIFKRYNIEKYIDLFKKIEEFIQKDIIDENMKAINKLSLEKLYDINCASLLVKQIENYKQNDAKQTKYITEIETDNKNKQAYINVLEDQIKDINQKLQEANIAQEKPEKKRGLFFRK